MIRHLTCLLLLLLAGCKMSTPPRPSSMDLQAMKDHQKALVMIRIVGMEAGTRVDLMRRYSTSDAAELQFADLASTAKFGLNASVGALDNLSWQDDWLYLVLKPGSYYLILIPKHTQEINAGLYTSGSPNYEQLRATSCTLRLDVPTNAPVFYAGTVYANCLSAWGHVDSFTAPTLSRDDAAAARDIAARTLPGQPAPAVASLTPYPGRWPAGTFTLAPIEAPVFTPPDLASLYAARAATPGMIVAAPFMLIPGANVIALAGFAAAGLGTAPAGAAGALQAQQDAPAFEVIAHRMQSAVTTFPQLLAERLHADPSGTAGTISITFRGIEITPRDWDNFSLALHARVHVTDPAGNTLFDELFACTPEFPNRFLPQITYIRVPLREHTINDLAGPRGDEIIGLEIYGMLSALTTHLAKNQIAPAAARP